MPPTSRTAEQEWLMQSVRNNLTCTRWGARVGWLCVRELAGSGGRRAVRITLPPPRPPPPHAPLAAPSEVCEPQVGAYFVNGTMTERQLQPLTMRTSSVCCITCRQWEPCVAW